MGGGEIRGRWGVTWAKKKYMLLYFFFYFFKVWDVTIHV